ncbi:MAG: hypothetical protein AVDCRST_MAG89-129, partial [uncultured Gemmatimonadetes bacterium]
LSHLSRRRAPEPGQPGGAVRAGEAVRRAVGVHRPRQVRPPRRAVHAEGARPGL